MTTTPAAIKLDQALTALHQPDGSPWTHSVLAARLQAEGIAVSVEQLAHIRGGQLRLPPRLAVTLAFVLGLPDEYFLETTTPTRAAELLHLTATRARHPGVRHGTEIPDLTDLRARLSALHEAPSEPRSDPG